MPPGHRHLTTQVAFVDRDYRPLLARAAAASARPRRERTLALDGELLPDVAGRLRSLRGKLDVHLFSADTYGQLQATAAALEIAATRLDAGGNEAAQKARFVRELGADGVVAVGNGMNDVEMLEAAALGIAVAGPRGLATKALRASDLVAASIGDALDLLLQRRRLVASLRR